MAVPKSKVSKARGNKRFASNYKVAVPTLVECPQCHEKKQSHRVCAKCGYYDGKQVIDMTVAEENN
ncbi:MAG: 50S ribosomal protein L32 [Clostridia bacterium]|jgi:large subunit ribosomal protein L32|nr:50S ribosomal protein L32 [Clostridia bacterium]